VLPRGSGESNLPFLEVAKNLPLHSKHIFWDSAEPNGTGTEVLKWAQFGERDQVRDKPMVYAHGSWHEGARIAFFVGTPREFEIDFVYGVRKSHDLEAVPVGVFEAHEDYPGVSSPKKGGVYVATANLAQHPVVISFGTNVFDWDEATVTDLQKSKWVFADSREMRKVRVPYTKFQKEHVSHITGHQAVVVHVNSRGHDLSGRGRRSGIATPSAKASGGSSVQPAKRAKAQLQLKLRPKRNKKQKQRHRISS